MEITGKIIAVLPAREGTSARTGNPWKVQEYVIETTNEQYPHKCAFEVFGDDKIRMLNIQAGEQLTVSLDIDAREYNGRWYNSIRAWRVDRTPAQDAPAPQQQPAADPFKSSPTTNAQLNEDNDDLPF